MLNILETIQDWIKGILQDCIMGNLNGLFDQINEQVGDVAASVGQTPAAWNAGVFSMIQSLSETVVVPIAGITTGPPRPSSPGSSSGGSITSGFFTQ